MTDILVESFLNEGLISNWNVAWSQTNGASTSACSETYKVKSLGLQFMKYSNNAMQGLAPGDASETAGLAAFLDAKAKSAAGAKMFIDWHSYSQLFMYREYLVAFPYRCISNRNERSLRILLL